jgi:hypothetical protein
MMNSKNLEGMGRGTMQVMFRHFPERAEETLENRELR